MAYWRGRVANVAKAGPLVPDDFSAREWDVLTQTATYLKEARDPWRHKDYAIRFQTVAGALKRPKYSEEFTGGI